ncbi:hypothetical protein HOLleu_39101 [Holothuria leucospilota]|uniref:Reverse transcriptase domain-containing protein n=1 Tax=Holothuria leucospilota TaxID=206669 RepID=A0A9Q0YGV4_HOLLE|nr:hypothetical protein HOLleu_39101 [Holothuria leucospilota]
MAEHLVSMEISNIDEYREIERKTNALANLWSFAWQANNRVRNNLNTTNNDVPPLYGLRKDHKPNKENLGGPPLRPVCGATTSCNRNLSYLLSQCIRPLVSSAPETCDSTEDLLSRIRDINMKKDKKFVVGSMDVTALYPSIDVDFAVKKCSDLLSNSSINFEGINPHELGLFLKVIEIETGQKLPEDVLPFCPVRSTNRGRKPTVTGNVSSSNTETRWSNWIKPLYIPSCETLRKMVVYALEYTMKFVMKNHVCQFNNKLYKQKSGGAIGVSLAGDVAQVFMIWWDREFKMKLAVEGINCLMYARYVDDILLVVESTSESCSDVGTMGQLCVLANAIHPSIQVTYDCPNLNADGRMPVLDLKVWPIDIVHDNLRCTIIQHTYYAKPMSSKHVIHKNGALNMKTKMYILTNDLVRIMRNVSLSLPEHERVTAVQSFINRMQCSGYSRYERFEVYSRAKKRLDKMIEDDKNGVVPLFRPKSWKQEERAMEKSLKKYTWFKDHKNNLETVLFVEATPNSVLHKNIERIINDTELKVKVVERSGTRLKNLLCKSNPFDREGCFDSTVCNLCKIKTGLCKKREVVYCIECIDCGNNFKYIGETSRSLGEIR